MMKYQLLVLDIDGTTVDSEKRLSHRTADALIRLQERGVRVVLASGRPPEGVYPIAERLEFDRFGSYILAFNGARIIDFLSRECLFEKRLPGHIPVRLREDAEKYEVGIAVYQTGAILAGTEPDRYMKAEAEITGLELKRCGDFAAVRDLDVNECLITGDPDDLEAIEPMLTMKYRHEAQIFHSEPWYLEVTPKNIDKSYGLKHLLQILEIPREVIVCCGDSYNDIAMIQYAGVGAAMANAADRVKAVADFVTEKDNDSDGVTEVIDRFFPEGK